MSADYPLMDDEPSYDRRDMDEYGDFCETLGYRDGYRQRTEECLREHHRAMCPAGVVGCDGWLLCADLRRN